MTDKQIIKKFNDNHCLVLENNQISLREDEITAYRIVLGKSTNELLEFVKDTYLQLKRKEQECERLKWYLKEIRDDELKTLDIELDEYETHCIDTEYTNIINLVEEALEERSPEDCRYGK